MWLMDVRTALWLYGAIIGAVLLAALTGIATWVALLLGALAGGVIATAVLGSAADRADAWMRTPKGPMRRRRR